MREPTGARGRSDTSTRPRSVLAPPPLERPASAAERAPSQPTRQRAERPRPFRIFPPSRLPASSPLHKTTSIQAVWCSWSRGRSPLPSSGDRAPAPDPGALGAGARGPRRLPSAAEAAVVCSGCRIFSDMVVVDAQAQNGLAGHAHTPLARSPEHRRRPPLVERAEARSGRHPTVTLREQERSPELPRALEPARLLCRRH